MNYFRTLKTKFVIISTMLLIVVLSYFGCIKPYEINTVKSVYFNGITVRDATGKLISNDTTDWRFGDKFTSRENALFTDTGSILGVNDSFKVISYENPYRYENRVKFSSLPQNAIMSFVLVDSSFKVLVKEERIDLAKNGGIIPGIGYGANPKVGDTFRFYYKIVVNGKHYNGHGDIQLLK